jgi:hypothetical protein
MTPRQRLLTLLKGGTPDQVPWFGDLDYWATGLIGRKLKSADFKTSADYIKWHQDLGVGFYLQGYFPYKILYEDCRVTVHHEGNMKITEIETPFGKLRDCWQYLPDSFSEAPIEHFIKSGADLKAWRYYYEHLFFEADYTLVQQRSEQINQAGILLAYLPHTPWMQLLVVDCGIETLSFLAFEVEDELSATLQVMKKKLDDAANLAICCSAEALMIPENLSSEMVGPVFFEKYLKNDQMDWLEKIHKAGKFSFIHMDGSLKGLLRQEASLPVTVLEALTPAPVGDLAIEQWAEWAGNSHTILWGGIPGLFFTAMVSDEQFEHHIKQVLAVMRKEPRYVLGVADQVPPDALESRVRRVAQLVDEHGKYS